MPRQSTAIPQVPPVVPHYIILEKNFRDRLDLIAWTGYTSSDGMYPVEQTDLVEQPGCADGRERPRPNQRKHADILSCTLTLPKYPIRGGV